jgi:hypothetical protein
MAQTFLQMQTVLKQLVYKEIINVVVYEIVFTFELTGKAYVCLGKIFELPITYVVIDFILVIKTETFSMFERLVDGATGGPEKSLPSSNSSTSTAWFFVDMSILF